MRTNRFTDQADQKGAYDVKSHGKQANRDQYGSLDCMIEEEPFPGTMEPGVEPIHEDMQTRQDAYRCDLYNSCTLCSLLLHDGTADHRNQHTDEDIERFPEKSAFFVHASIIGNSPVEGYCTGVLVPLSLSTRTTCPM